MTYNEMKRKLETCKDISREFTLDEFSLICSISSLKCLLDNFCPQCGHREPDHKSMCAIVLNTGNPSN